MKALVLDAKQNIIEFNYKDDYRYIVGGRLHKLSYFSSRFCHRKDFAWRILERTYPSVLKNFVASSLEEVVNNKNKGTLSAAYQAVFLVMAP